MAMEDRADVLTEGLYGSPAAGGRGRSSAHTGRSTTSPTRRAYADADTERGKATCTEMLGNTEAANGKMTLGLNTTVSAEHNELTELSLTTPPGPPACTSDTQRTKLMCPWTRASRRTKETLGVANLDAKPVGETETQSTDGTRK